MHQKLLRADTGTPLIIETWNSVMKAAGNQGPLDEVYITTDSDEIAAVCKEFRTCCWGTGEHKSGTDRIAEFADRFCKVEACDLIVNIQADEPEIKPEHIKALIDAATMVPGCDMATLAAPLNFERGEFAKDNVVKVQVASGFADSFGRSMHQWERFAEIYHHLGVYAYTPRFLKWFTSLPQSAGEQRERLEQLRALDNGARIRVALVDEAWPGIDTEEEYQAFVKRWKERQCPTTQSASA